MWRVPQPAAGNRRARLPCGRQEWRAHRRGRGYGRQRPKALVEPGGRTLRARAAGHAVLHGAQQRTGAPGVLGQLGGRNLAQRRLPGRHSASESVKRLWLMAMLRACRSKHARTAECGKRHNNNAAGFGRLLDAEEGQALRTDSGMQDTTKHTCSDVVLANDVLLHLLIGPPGRLGCASAP